MNNPAPAPGLASPIVRQLEWTYDLLRRKHPDLPADIVFVLGQGKMRGGIKWGHYAPHRWSSKDPDAIRQSLVPEVLISAECLAAGGHQVMQTLVHEAVHALAAVRGVKETSRQGRYHNKKFVALSAELGMFYPHDEPHPTIGWSMVELTAESQQVYAPEIEAFDRVIKVAKDSGLIPASTIAPKRKPKTVALVEFQNGDTLELTEATYNKVAVYLDDHTMSLVTS